MRNRMASHQIQIRPSFADSIKCNLMQVKSSSSPKEGREYCKMLYEDVREHYFQVSLVNILQNWSYLSPKYVSLFQFQGCHRRTDLYFFRVLGTSDLSKYFYGHVDHDLGSRFESWFKCQFKTIVMFLDRPKVFNQKANLMGIFNTIIYYLVWLWLELSINNFHILVFFCRIFSRISGSSFYSTSL